MSALLYVILVNNYVNNSYSLLFQAFGPPADKYMYYVRNRYCMDHSTHLKRNVAVYKDLNLTVTIKKYFSREHSERM